MTLYRWKVYFLIIFLSRYPICSGAANTSQCFANVIACAQNSSDLDCVSSLNISNTSAFSILATSQGSLAASTDTATALTYSGCITYCGTSPQPFSWSVFAQEYAAWLLPYLALLSQLPFGARRRMDNLMSATLTLGSPTLAGYSLYMTLLNARWVNDHLFSGIDYPSAALRCSVVRVLSCLQQVPLRINPGQSARLESLVVHPDNDEWWIMLADELGYEHMWSIASATSIAWVVIAYLLTVADSISNMSNNINSSGQGTGSGWLWLLPIVVGWLVLSPKCDYDQVHDAYHKANRHVFVADSRDPTAAPTQVTSDFGLTIDPSPDWAIQRRDHTSPDEFRIPPVFNYARVFSWAREVHEISLYYRTAWRKSNRRVGVDGKPIPGNVRNNVPRESRLGTRDQIIRYCRPDDGESRTKVLFPQGLILNMIVASLMSLQLQWGTTGAAVLAVWFTPTVGLGCRSLAYLIYGALSTLVWFLLVLSSILGYYADSLVDSVPVLDTEWVGHCTPSKHPIFTSTASLTDDVGILATENNVAVSSHITQESNYGVVDSSDSPIEPDIDAAANIVSIKYPRARCSQTFARAIGCTADWLRWAGKLLAIANAISIVANSVFQYAGLYTNCYCDSSVYTWSSFAFNVIQPNANDIDLARNAWIGGLGLGLTSCILFVGAIYLVRDSLPS